MTGLPPEEMPLQIHGLLGVGLDGKRNEKRITRGENFALFGGSKATHERMVETAVKFNEKVGKLGKELPQVNARELGEITHELREEIR